MASVPNLPIAPAVPIPGAPGAAAEGAPLDIFAQLLSGGPAIAVVTAPGAIPPEGATLRAAPAEGEAESADEETAPVAGTPPDIIPLLQAQSGFPVTVAQPAQATAAPVEVAPAAVTPDGKSLRVPPVAVPGIADPRTVKPESDAAPVDALVDAAVKAAVEKIAGKQLARTGRAGKAAPTEGKAIEPAAPVDQPVRPETTAARIEAVIQAAAPTAGTASTAPIAPAFSAIPVAAQPVAAATPNPNAVPAVADLVIERQLDLASDDQWLDRLARDIARAGASDEPLRFRLHPQTLGHLQVELSQSDRGANIRLTVETEAARSILVDAQPRLAAEARAQGIRLAGTEVDLGTAGQQGGDARRNAEAEPQNVVRVVRGQSDSTPTEPAAARSDRYA